MNNSIWFRNFMIEKPLTKVERLTDEVTNYILKQVDGDIELAHQVAIQLAALDWQQTIIEKQQEDLNKRMGHMKSFLDYREKGLGFCDLCQDDNYVGGYHHGTYTEVLSWPHSWPEKFRSELPRYGRFCHYHFFKLQREMFEYLANRQFDPFNQSQEEAIRIYWVGRQIWDEKEMVLCNGCKRLIPRKAVKFTIREKHDHYPMRSPFYCLHCIESAVEKQFIICSSCSKKTASFSYDLCYDCYKKFTPYHSQVSSHLERAKQAGTPATLTVKQWALTVAYFNGKCAYCRSRPFQVLEHFLPLSLGGGTTADNCVPACQPCNSKKGHLHPDSLIRIFPEYIIQHIKQYLQGEKRESNPFPVTGRELIIL